MLASLFYLALRRVLALGLLRFGSTEFKELEIVVLRHELEILRRQTRRPRLRRADRVFLAAASRVLPRCRWSSLFVSPDTLLRWHRQLVARRWTYRQGGAGRPPVAREVRELVLRLARENPRWGYQRIAAEIAGLGFTVSATTVRKVIRTPMRAPTANAVAERFVGTVRRECLDCILIISRRQLERVLRAYVDHYNDHRPQPQPWARSATAATNAAPQRAA